MITLDQGGRARGIARTLPVDPGVGGVVEFVWVLRGVPASARSWRVVPDHAPHLIHHRFPDGRVVASVVGPRTRWIDVDQGARAYTVGIRLRPGALPGLVGMSAWELRDRSVSIEDAFGAVGAAARRRLEDETDPDRAAGVLVRLLSRAVSPAVPRTGSRAAARGDSEPVDWRVRGFLHRIGREPGTRVRDAARALGVGERTLREVSCARLGLRPKEAARIVRLHRALASGIDGVPDAAAAVAAGFVDQAHLIRESNALLGETPPAFRARAADSYKTS